MSYLLLELELGRSVITKSANPPITGTKAMASHQALKFASWSLRTVNAMAGITENRNTKEVINQIKRMNQRSGLKSPDVTVAAAIPTEPMVRIKPTTKKKSANASWNSQNSLRVARP